MKGRAVAIASKQLLLILFSLLFVGNFVFSKDIQMEGKALHLKKGESVTLSERTAIRFMGHSHKRTHEDQVSPLIVCLEYSDGTQVMDTEYFNVSRDHRVAEWHGLHLEFGKSDYNKWQEIRITEIGK
jgi:hypothetical protein